jgi:hypothetical protein
VTFKKRTAESTRSVLRLVVKQPRTEKPRCGTSLFPPTESNPAFPTPARLWGGSAPLGASHLCADACLEACPQVSKPSAFVHGRYTSQHYASLHGGSADHLNAL